VHFCGIHPDPALTKRLADATRLIVTERDASTAEVVTADLIALFAPRIWAELDETSRRNPRAIELRYVFDTGELDQLALALQWKPQQEGMVA